MKTSAKLGIVYTPVEVVDFILNSVNDVLKKNFGKTLSDKNIHILDPFTGTGTFLVRLIQSNLIQKKDLLRKFSCELHANEIILLAYYIAAVNIENAFHSDPQKYFQFQGICFTDTFAMYERDDVETFEFALEKNSERIDEQKKEKIEIIVGNPPYAVGKKSDSKIDITPTLKIPTNFEMFQTYIKFLKNIFGFIVDGVIKKSLKLTPQKLRQQIKILFTILTLKHFAGQATELKKAA